MVQQARLVTRVIQEALVTQVLMAQVVQVELVVLVALVVASVASDTITHLPRVTVARAAH